MTKSTAHEQPATKANNVGIELTAKELDRVAGGGKAASGGGKGSQPQEYLVYNMTEVFITSVPTGGSGRD
jgi:hypothetical protein